MTESNIKDVIAWAAKENVLIMADEVYQTNVYGPQRPRRPPAWSCLPEYELGWEAMGFTADFDPPPPHPV
jgi:aspartate/methionine/tyrosine aminotransferase